MLPLDSLLHRLESAGFRVSPADRLRVVQLLDAMGSKCLENPQKLRLLLAPILARSAAEQAKFYEVFDQWMPTPSSDDSKSSDEYSKRTRRRWLIAAGLIILAVFVAWYFTRPEPAPTLPKEEITQNAAPDSTGTDESPTILSQEKPAEQEILKPQLPIKELLLAKEQETPRPSWLAWSLLALLTLAAGWMWWKWAKRAAPKPLVSDRPPVTAASEAALGEIADAPPYTIPFRGQEAYIRTGREQYRLADAMRQRQQGEHPYMDVPASVQATLDKGGFPTLRFRLRRQPADYLCVIDEKHRQSHLTRLFKFFAEHIRGQDVALEIFQASSTLDRFWNAQYPGGLTLDQLQRLFPAHRLLLFGDAHALLDVAASGQARVRPEMGAAFRRWRQRVLFTPDAPGTWTFEEKALYDLFALFPATLQGMNDAAHHIEASVGVSADDEAPPTFARWRERAQQLAQSAFALRAMAGKAGDHRYTRWRDAADHEEYLAGRPDLLRWLRALAVYPTPTWEITLAIGQSLEKQGVTVRPDDLLILSRIGWLQTGRMPSALREEFMADLPQEAEKAARQATLDALEEARTEAGNGFAGIELGVNVAIQEFALAPEDPEKQEVMRLLFEAGRVNKTQEMVADGALARHVARSKNSEAFKTSEVSATARDLVKKEDKGKPETEPSKRSFFTKHFWMAIGLTLVVVPVMVIVILLETKGINFQAVFEHLPRYGLYQEEKGDSWKVRYIFRWSVVPPDSAIIWNNRGVQAWNERRDTIEAMRLFEQAMFRDSAGLKKMKLVESIDTYMGAFRAYENAQKLRYNLIAALLNEQFEILNLPPTDTLFYYDGFADLSLLDRVKKKKFSISMFGEKYQEAPFRRAIRLASDQGVLLTESNISPLKNDALHAVGLAQIYLLYRNWAESTYSRLYQRDSAYFNNLHSSRPNLETLLGKIFNRILSMEASLDTLGKLHGKIYFQLKDPPESPPVLIVEMLDKNGKVLARASLSQPKAVQGLNQTTFLIPSDPKTATFVADSLRVILLSSNQMGKTLAMWNKAFRFEWKDPKSTDSDGDGVFDIQDDCPSIKGIKDNRGCPFNPLQSVLIDNLKAYPNKVRLKTLGGEAQAVPVNVIKAFDLYDTQKYSEAANAFQSIVAINADRIDYHFYWGISLIYDKQYSAAIAALTPVVQSQDENRIPALYYLGLACAGSGDTYCARQNLQAYIDLPEAVIFRKQAQNVLKALPSPTPEEAAFQKAKSENTLPAWRNFRMNYPNSKFNEAAETSIRELQSEYSKSLQDAVIIIEVDREAAREHVLFALHIDPNGVDALRLLKSIDVPMK